MEPGPAWRRSTDLRPLLGRLEDLSGRISVQTWADSLGLSPRTLQRRFAAVAGAPTPHDVLLLRLQAEREHDLAAGRSIEDSAERLGYESASTLRRALRRGSELLLAERGEAGTRRSTRSAPSTS